MIFFSCLNFPSGPILHKASMCNRSSAAAVFWNKYVGMLCYCSCPSEGVKSLALLSLTCFFLPLAYSVSKGHARSNVGSGLTQWYIDQSCNSCSCVNLVVSQLSAKFWDSSSQTFYSLYCICFPFRWALVKSCWWVAFIFLFCMCLYESCMLKYTSI